MSLSFLVSFFLFNILCERKLILFLNRVMYFVETRAVYLITNSERTTDNERITVTPFRVSKNRN